MKNFVLKASILGLALASGQAMAHVGYGSALYLGAGVYDPLTGNTNATAAYGGNANFTSTVSSNGGYLAGLNPDTLGNTHDIRFRYFILDQASNVSFTINGGNNSQVSGNANPTLNGLTASRLNPGFSLYTGVLPASSHEGVGDIANVAADTNVANYLSTANDFASWSPFTGVNGIRGGLAAGATGNNPGLWGVFDTNGSITTGNNGAYPASGVWPTTNNGGVSGDTHGANYLGGLDTPKIASIAWTGIAGADAAVGGFTNSSGGTTDILGADGVVDNQVSWSGTLAAGVYTLAIGGANLSDYNQFYSDIIAGGAIQQASKNATATTAAITGTAIADAYAADRLARNLSITGFSVTAVPVPGAVWMFLTGAFGLLGLNRRKARA